MAVISNDGVTFEIKYLGYFAEWVSYEFSFLWHGKSIINESILEGNRGTLPVGSMWANDSHSCGLLPVLENVIKTNRSDYWEPTEPDVIFAFYPDNEFPFLPNRWQTVFESEESRGRREERAKQKAVKIALPDDYITLILFVDTYAFKNCPSYGGNGVSLHMLIFREEFERFYDELRSEYFDFKKRFGIDGVSLESPPDL